MRISIILIASLLLLQGPLVAALNLSHAEASDDGALAVHYASSSPIASFTVIVSRTGFNGTSGIFTLQVNQSDEVRITFVYGDGDLTFDNPHTITIDGYGITTATIDRSNPNATVDFVAGQVGSFKFYCSTPCYGMDSLQQGLLDVKAGGSEVVKTSIAITHCHMHAGEFLHVMVSLDDVQGNPVSGALVHFALNTTLGWMEIGKNVTATNGYSQVLYPLKSPVIDEVAAIFSGSGIYAPSNTTATFPAGFAGADLSGTPFLSGQNPLIDLRLVGIPPYISVVIVALVLTIVGSVWLTYGYVVRQIINIRKHSKDEVGGSK